MSGAAGIRRFTIDDPQTFRQVGDTGVSVGDVLDASHGVLMNVGFARAGKGTADLVFAYDTVLVATKGAAVVGGGQEPLRVDAGDLLYLPRGTAGTFEIGEDLEAVYVSHPPHRQVVVEAVRGAVAQRFSLEDPGLGWMQVADRSIYLSDTVGDAPGFSMDTGYARVEKGEGMDFAFPYDEVLIATKGTFTVHAGDEALTARVGELVYLPTGVPGRFVADEDVDTTNVAFPPYVEIIKESGRALGTASPEQQAEEEELRPVTPPWLR